MLPIDLEGPKVVEGKKLILPVLMAGMEVHPLLVKLDTNGQGPKGWMKNSGKLQCVCGSFDGTCWSKWSRLYPVLIACSYVGK